MATPGEQPTNPLSEAKACLGRKDFGRALEKATEAVTAAPKDAVAYLVRAEALRLLKRPDRALADLAVAIRLDPERPAPYVVRAEIHKKRCQFDQAVADATHAIFLDPNNAAAYSIRASCRQSIGDAEGASEDQEELFRIDPTRLANDPAVQSSPAKAPSPGPDGRIRGAILDDDRHQFADGKPVDRSYRSRPAVGGDDAAEVLGEVSGYKPGSLTKPLSRGRSRSKAPSRGVGYGLGLLGVGVVVGCLLTMRGGGTPAPGREPQPHRVPAAIPLARADDGGSDNRLANGDYGKATGPKILAVKAEPPKAAIEPAPQQATTPSPPPAGETPKGIRIRFSMSGEGDCRLVVDAREENHTEEKIEGEPVKLMGVPNAAVRRTEAGLHRIAYSFGGVGSTADFGHLNGVIPSRPAGLSIDRTAGLLIMTPTQVETQKGKKAVLGFPRLLKAPIEVSIVFDDPKPGTFILQLNHQTSPAVFGLRLHPDPQDKNSIHAGFFWIPVVNGKRAKEMNLLDRTFASGNLTESGFHLPISQNLSNDRYSLDLAYYGEGPISIRRLDIQAKIPPSFGISLDNDKAGVKLVSAFQGGASDTAGLKAEDVLVSIDGEKFTDAKSMTTRLANTTIGKEAKFVLRRAGQEKTIVVKGE